MEKKSKLTSKKLIVIILAVFLVCGAVLGILAYLSNQVKQVASEEGYGYVNPDETKVDPDAGITIDGVLDEKVYQDNNWLYMRNDNGNATVDIAMTSYYGDKGMYFVYDVTESTPIYVNLNRNSAFNSCVELYLALSDVTDMDRSEIFEIDLLPTGDVVFKQRNGKGAFMDVATSDDMMAYLGTTTKGGEVNSEDCYGYNLEFFIPWDYLEFLGLDVESMKTDYVFVNTAHITSYNYAGTAETDRYWYSFAQQLGGNGWGNVSLYYRFDKDGVIGAVPVELEQGEHYTITGAKTVIPGVKTHVVITPEEGYAINSILVNGEEYIKKVSYNEDGSIALDVRGVKEGLKISASAEAVTEGNKTLSGTIKVHKVGGDSLTGVTASYMGPDGEKPLTFDSKGNFTLTDLQQGYYTITVEKEGYEKIERGIYLNRNIETELTLEYVMFEVESGRCWQLEEVNDGIINKMGGFGSLLTTNSYNKFSIEANFKYYEDVAESLDEQDRLEQRQGIRIKFSNDKYWHIDLLYQNERYFIQYAKATTDSIFNFRDIYVLSDEEIAQFKSEDGIQLKVVRDGNRAIIYLGGNLIAVEDLDKEYTSLTAKLGFESWGPFTDVRTMNYKISTDVNVDVNALYFGYHKNWDVTKQFEGVVSQPNGGNTVWLRFYEKIANMDLTFRVKDNPKVDGENPRTSIRFEFDNGETFIASICENANGVVQIQKYPCTYTNNKWKGSYYNFTDAEKAQYKTEEGIDFRVVRNGTEILFFIGGEYKTSVDLSELISADTPAIVSIQHVDDKGVPYEMPFTISEEVQNVIIANKESSGKDVKTTKGTTVVVSAEEGYYIKTLSLNGKDVSEGLTWDGTYVFIAEEANYTMKATLAKRIFETDYGWDLLEQNQGTKDGVTTGVVSLPNGGTTSSNLIFIQKYADMDLTWRVKDHPDSDADNTTAPRTSFEFIFDEVLTGENKTFTLSVSDSNKGVVQIQNTSGLKDKTYTSYYNFDDDETAKYRSADGVDFRIVRQGTDFILFVDGELKAVVDLSKYITADTKATVRINHNDDNGVRLDMPYAVTDKVDIEKIYFGYHKNWNVTNQFEGSVMQPNGGNTVWLRFFEKIATMDLTIKVLDNPNVEGDEPSTNVRFEFDNDETFLVGIGVNSSDGSIHLWNQKSTTNEKVKSLYKFSADEQAQYETEEGIDFRIVRNGTDILFFIGGEYKACVDLSEFIEGDTPSVVSIMHYGDVGVPYVMPFTLVEELDLVTIKTEANDGKKLVTDKTSYVVGQEVNVEAEEGYYIKKITVNGEAVTVDQDGTYSFIAEEKEYEIEAVVEEKLFVTQTGWDLRKQNGGTKDGVTTGKVTLPNGGIGGGDGWLYFIEKYIDMDLTIIAKDDPNASGEPRTTIGFTFGDKAVAISLTQNTKGVVVQNYPAITNTINTGWTDYKVLEASEVAQYKSEEGTGLKFRAVRKGTDLVIYVEDVDHDGVMEEAAHIDLSAYGISATDKATVAIRHEGESGNAKEIPFEFTTNVVATTITTTMKDTYGTFAVQNTHNFVGDKILIKRTSYDKVAAKHLAAVKVDGETTINLDADATCGFVATKEEHSVKGIYRNTIFTERSTSNWNVTQQNQGTDDNGTTSGVVSINGGLVSWLYLYEIDGAARYGDIDLTFTLKDFGGTTDSSSQIKFAFRDATNTERVLQLTVAESNGKVTFKQEDHRTMTLGIGAICELDYDKYTGDGVDVRVRREGTEILLYVDNVFQKSIDLSEYIENDSLARVGIIHYGDVGKQVEIPYKLRLPNIIVENSEYGTVVADKSFCDIGDTVVIQEGELLDSSYYLAGLLINDKEVELGSDGTYTLTVKESSYVIEGIYRKKIFKDNANWDLTQQNQGTDENGVTSGVITYTDKTGLTSWLYLYGETSAAKEYSDIDLTLNLRNYSDSVKNANTQVKFETTNSNGYWFRFVVEETSTGGVKIFRTGTDGNLSSKPDYEFSSEEIAAYNSENGIDLRVKREGTKFYVYVGGVLRVNLDFSSKFSSDTKAAVCILHDNDIDITVSIPYKLILPSVRIEDSEYGTVVADKYSYGHGDTIVIQEGETYDSSYYLAGLLINGEEVELASDGTYTLTATKISYVIEGIFRKKIFTDNSNWNLTKQNQGTDENGVTSGVITYTDKTGLTSWLYLYQATANAKEYGDVDLTLNIRNYDGKFTTSNTQVKFEFANGKWFRFVAQETDAGGVKVFRTGDAASSLDFEFTAEEIAAYSSAEGVNIQVKREGTMFYFYVNGVVRKSLNLSSLISSDTKTAVCILRDNDIDIETSISYKLSFPEEE